MELDKFNDNTLRVLEGKREKEYDIKCKFYDDSNNEYWIYSSNKEDKKGNIDLHVSKVNEVDGEISLEECTNSNEIKLVVDMYEALKKHVVVEGGI